VPEIKIPVFGLQRPPGVAEGCQRAKSRPILRPKWPIILASKYDGEKIPQMLLAGQIFSDEL